MPCGWEEAFFTIANKVGGMWCLGGEGCLGDMVFGRMGGYLGGCGVFGWMGGVWKEGSVVWKGMSKGW